MPGRRGAEVWKSLLTSAGEEARRRGDRRLGTLHLLLGLLHEQASRAARALGVSLAEARAASEALDVAALAAVGIVVEGLGAGTAAPFGRRLPPLTSGARGVLRRALDQARHRGRDRVESAHFLLALLELGPPDPAADLLERLRIDRAAVRERLAHAPGGDVA